MIVTVLFARPDSNYKSLPGCDVWDRERDTRSWQGGAPVVAHPPCRAWGRLRQFAKPREGEKDLALLAVAHVRTYGGVLEHPAGSTLWAHLGLPLPSAPADAFDGYTIEIEQYHFGHRAEKRTWLYIVGCAPRNLPAVPRREGAAPCVISTRMRKGPPGYRPCVTKAEREHTPPALASWLREVALRSVEFLQ